MANRMWRRVLVAVCATLLPGWGAAQALLYYPRPESDKDPRVAYPLTLLRLALEKSGAPVDLQPSKARMQQGRALREVELGTGKVHVVWSMTSREREAATRPIRIPIYKGLIGWRLPLVRSQDAQRLATVQALGDLQAFSAGQGHDWPDTEILRANGLTVHGVAAYEALFQMLEAGRFAYFPRSVIEIWAEAAQHASRGIVVDPNLALHYPAAFYYFVHRDNAALAQTIEKGLEKAIADGSFDRLFHKHFDAVLRASALERRRVIELHNPLLPPETPLQRKELWYQPGRVTR